MRGTFGLVMAVTLGLSACKGETTPVPDTAAAPATTSSPVTSAPPDASAATVTSDAAATTTTPEIAAQPDAAPAATDIAGPSTTPARTRLLTPGAEPRRALRYAPPAGLVQVADLTMTTELELGATGQKMPEPLPKTRMTIEARNAAVDAASAVLRVRLAITEADLAEGAAATPNRAGEKLTEVIRGMKGLAGEKTVDARGQSQEFTLAFPEGGSGPMTTAALRPVVQGFERAIDQMTVPFPDEPIGVGAKWEVAQKVLEAGMTLDQTTTFEVTGVDGVRVSLRFSVTLAAPPGKLESRFASGLSAEVERLTGSGDGTIEVDLGKVLPVALSTRNAIAMGLLLADAQGKKTALDVDMRVALECKSR